MYNPADILNNVISYCINIYCILVYSRYLLRYWVSVVRTYLAIFTVASPRFRSRRLSGLTRPISFPFRRLGFLAPLDQLSGSITLCKICPLVRTRCITLVLTR